MDKNNDSSSMNNSIDNEVAPPPSGKRPSCFTDERGNLKVVNLVVRHPCKIFFSILIVNLFLTILLIGIVANDGNPFADTGSEYDTNDIRSLAYDSLRLAIEDVEDLREDIADSQLQSARIQEQSLDITYWVYEAEDDLGVFGSSESIRGMQESQTLFRQDASYESFCWREYGTVWNETTNATEQVSRCRLPLTPLNIYYAASWDRTVASSVIAELTVPGNVPRYNDLAICIEFNTLCDEVPGNYTDDDYVWARALNENITILTDAWDGSGELLEDDLSQVTTFIGHMFQLITKKGLVDFGFDKNFGLENPVSMFSRALFTWGGPLEQTSEEDIEDEDEREETDEDALKDIAGTSHNSKINSYYFMGVLLSEVLLQIVTQDALLALVSFGVVFLYLRLTVGSWFLAVVGMSEIMLSVPVSWFIYKVIFRIEYFAFLNALSLFIVAAIGADDIFIFMDAYKQSAHSNDPKVLESLESRMSWVYRRTGSAMAITSATTCSAFLATLITPLASIQSFGIFAAIVIFIDYVLVMSLFCTAVVIYHNKFERPGCFSSCSAGCRTESPSSTDRALENICEDTEKEGDRIGLFFRNKMSPFINKGLNRLFLGIVFLAWIIVAITYAIQIEPTQEAEQFLREDHPLQKSVTILNNEFPTAEDDEGLEIFFAWGLDEVDRDGVKLLLDPDFFGTPQYTEGFEFNEQCQTELLRACSVLKTNNEYQPYIKQEAGLGTVSCFLEEFGAYAVLGSLDDCLSVRAGAWQSEDWQVPTTEVPVLMEGFLQQRSCFSDEGRTILDKYQDALGWDGRQVRFAAVSLESSVIDPFSTLPEKTVRIQYDQMIEISRDLDNSVGEACSGKVVMTDLETKFVFMNNQSIYQRSALQSSLLGVCIAFVVLLLATRVLHVAIFATLSIGCVLVSVTGSMVLFGWKLGSTESVLISIVAGFSVDYVVHLSHAYAQAKGGTFERLTTAFGEMGISVLNGMVTSLGASVPLFFCQLTFFSKFGTFMFLTIMFSWLFANLGFMSLLAQFKLPVRKQESSTDKPPSCNENTESGITPTIGNDFRAINSADSEETA